MKLAAPMALACLALLPACTHIANVQGPPRADESLTSGDLGPPALPALQQAGVRLEVRPTSGQPSHMDFEPAAHGLARCRSAGGGGGKVEVLVSKDPTGGVSLSVRPGSSLDPTATHCVLEALSAVDIEQTGANTGGTSIRPSGFSSLVTVSW